LTVVSIVLVESFILLVSMDVNFFVESIKVVLVDLVVVEPIVKCVGIVSVSAPFCSKFAFDFANESVVLVCCAVLVVMGTVVATISVIKDCVADVFSEVVIVVTVEEIAAIVCIVDFSGAAVVAMISVNVVMICTVEVSGVVVLGTVDSVVVISLVVDDDDLVVVEAIVVISFVVVDGD
jgi:hypothetical protein